MRRRTADRLAGSRAGGFSPRRPWHRRRRQIWAPSRRWTAWQGQDDYGKICFISAAPDIQRRQPRSTASRSVRDPPHFLIIHRDKAPAVNADGTAAKDKNGNPQFRKVRNEVQTLMGYPLQPTTDSFFHTAAIDGKVVEHEIDPRRSVDPHQGQRGRLARQHRATRPGSWRRSRAGTKLVVNGTSLQGHQDHRHLFAGRRHRRDGRHRQGLPVSGTARALGPLRAARSRAEPASARRFACAPLSRIILVAVPAPRRRLAQSVQQIGEFKDWTAYSASEGAGAVCFAMSKPTDVSTARPTATPRPIST